MKSFFKKLAFVMALTMVVSLAAPAATTAAAAEESPLKIAYQGGMAITEINLMSAGDFEDLRFLGVPNYKELGGATWSSNNEAVATVDAVTGLVTAVANGTAVVTVTIGDMTASVTVNVGTLPTYNVTIGIPAEGKDAVTEKTLKIGESVDFNFKGIKDYSRDKIGTLPRYLCTWQSDDTTVLTKDNEAGLFTAVKAGTAKVTLTVANVLTGKTHNVVPVLVTVEADATPTPTPCLVENPINGGNWNATQNTVLINVAESAKLDIDDIEFYHVFTADNDENGDGVIDDRDLTNPYEHFYVKSVSYNKDEAAWVVTTFDDFTDGVTYEITVNGRTERFVASVGDVAKVVLFETDKAVLATDDVPAEVGYVNVKLYDAKGVDVTTRLIDGVANNNEANIFYTTESSNDYSLGYNDIEFYEDVEATIVATYNANGVEVPSLPLTVSPSKLAAYGVEEVVAWTLVEPGKKADWKKIVHTIPAGEEGWVIATLIKDTRGDYYTTHQASAGDDKYEDANGKKHDVAWTENSDASFWKNGLYVEYKAMNPDKMLVEEYGEIASYEQGTARYALYLYNYNKFDNEFDKELYSQNITVCHPRTMNGMQADTNVSIMMNTETDPDVVGGTDVADAYYSKFSVTKVIVKLIDTLHENKLAKDVDALDAYFDVTLLTNQVKGKESDDQYEALKALVEETYAGQLNAKNKLDADGDKDVDANDTVWAYRGIKIEARDFMGLYTEGRSQIKFKITEAVTKKSVTVTVNLKQLVPTTIKNAKGEIVEYSEVAIVKELSDELGVNVYFEKFVLANTNLTAEQNIWNAASWYDATVANNHRIFLEQKDQKNNLIGYDSNLYLAQTANPNHVSDIYIVTGTDTATEATSTTVQLRPGDRVMYVKDPSGKLYPIIGANDAGVANTVFNKKVAALDEDWAMAATAASMGITVTHRADKATASGGAVDAINIGAYELRFRSVNDDTNEYEYAKNGRYTIVIQTIEDVDNDPYQITKITDLKKSEFFTKNASGDVTFLNVASYDGIATRDNLIYYTLNEDNDWVEVCKGEDISADGTTIDTTEVWGVQVTNATGDDYLVNEDYGKVYYASGSGLKSTAYITVDNNNPQVTYAGRDLTRIENTLYYTETGAGAGDDEYMKEVILEAFNFNLSSLGWTEDRDTDGNLQETGNWKLSVNDILYFTYTVSPTNNQIVINTVTFKVPVITRDGWGNPADLTGNWYRSTCTINKALTFED